MTPTFSLFMFLNMYIMVSSVKLVDPPPEDIYDIIEHVIKKDVEELNQSIIFKFTKVQAGKICKMFFSELPDYKPKEDEDVNELADHLKFLIMKPELPLVEWKKKASSTGKEYKYLGELKIGVLCPNSFQYIHGVSPGLEERSAIALHSEGGLGTMGGLGFIGEVGVIGEARSMVAVKYATEISEDDFDKDPNKPYIIETPSIASASKENLVSDDKVGSERKPAEDVADLKIIEKLKIDPETQ